jgi:hypothetical protein
MMKIMITMAITGPEVDAVFEGSPSATAHFDHQPSGVEMRAMWEAFRDAIVPRLENDDWPDGMIETVTVSVRGEGK